MSDAAVAAIKYVLKNQGESPIEFLHAWTYGNFDAIRKEWENVPDEVFIGADPLHPETIKQQNIQKEQSKEIADLCAELEALKRQEPSVPDGWKLVPKEPTQEMVRACASAARAYMQEHGGNSPEVMWSAMLAAAPQPERSAGDERGAS